jgi:peptide-methionine (S)-S-oxide reductase
VDSGYSGGSAETAFYKQVGTGHTGHAEAVEIIYDPELISYETLLDVFFTVAHDPTQYNYQGPDVGTEYRSAIFYTDESQQKKAHTMIQKLTEEKVYTNPIVTELVPLDSFYPAEDYHQDFLRLNPTHGYIAYWDIPKLEHLWEEYPELVYE